MDDTIFALASARGRSGVAVLRISGPSAQAALLQLAADLPAPRVATLKTLRKGDTVLDEALVISFPKPASFTGEDVVELHLHGGAAVVSSVLAALAAFDGLRLAQAGEFTRRAMENGRLDLAQVEGLADLIDAETEVQRHQAMRLMQGDLSQKTALWRADLLRALSLLEASIDFADEDVPVDVYPEVNALLQSLVAIFHKEVKGVGAAERIRDGFEVAILGLPNSGKSTLMNKIAGREVALTSDIAGTTRDVIELRIDLGGLAVTLLDTAGLRESEDAIETMGVERARNRADAADLRVFLLGDTGEMEALGVRFRDGDEIVFAKADRAPTHSPSVSGLTGEGIDGLLARIAETLQHRIATIGTAVKQRHMLALQRAATALEAASEQLSWGSAHAELAAEDLRVALRALDSLIGKVDVEQVLDVIFSSFCIGK
ncbi:MAG: tRNA uridine-5-carboxymethylaminomethyl(34) synthesis GTPase MnmE [Paracoccaceae bacterium]